MPLRPSAHDAAQLLKTNLPYLRIHRKKQQVPLQVHRAD